MNSSAGVPSSQPSSVPVRAVRASPVLKGPQGLPGSAGWDEEITGKSTETNSLCISGQPGASDSPLPTGHPNSGASRAAAAAQLSGPRAAPRRCRPPPPSARPAPRLPHPTAEEGPAGRPPRCRAAASPPQAPPSSIPPSLLPSVLLRAPPAPLAPQTPRASPATSHAAAGRRSWLGRCRTRVDPLLLSPPPVRGPGLSAPAQPHTGRSAAPPRPGPPLCGRRLP